MNKKCFEILSLTNASQKYLNNFCIILCFLDLGVIEHVAVIIHFFPKYCGILKNTIYGFEFQLIPGTILKIILKN